MSRGAGRIQRAILETLREAGGELPLSSLAWEVAEREGLADDGNLDQSVYNNVLRAAQALARAPSERASALRRELRAITTVREMCRWFPDRTKLGKIRQMRKKLLPHVKAFRGKQKVGRIQPEDYEWPTLHRPHPSAAPIRALWPETEQLLIQSWQTVSPGHRTAILELVARGREKLIPGSRVGSTAPLIGNVILLSALVNELPARLIELLSTIRDLFPIDAYRRARFMATLRVVVSMKKGQPVSVTRAFKEHLLEVEPDYVRSLPGHVDAKRHRRHAWIEIGSTRFSADLDSLCDRAAVKAQPWYILRGSPPSVSIR